MKKVFGFVLLLFICTGVSAQVIEFKDEFLKNELLTSPYFRHTNGEDAVVDTNNNGEIEVSEALDIIEFNLQPIGVKDLSGIEYFLNITALRCQNNSLKNVDISKNVNLEIIGFESNQLETIDFSKNTKLRYLRIFNNKLTSLDVSQNILLEDLACDFNPFTFLNIKNGVNKVPDLSGCSSLAYVCADQNEIETLTNEIQRNNFTNVSFNTYCTFSPGGKKYTIKGTNKDCISLSAIPNLKMSITNGNESGDLILDDTGDYSIEVGAGVHTLFPKFENIGYYTVTPEKLIVEFPKDAGSIIQDFCFTPVPNKNDVEVMIFPIGTPARPGFDADYKITYKNMGTTILSGTVDLKFDDTVLDYLSASEQNISKSLGNLIWDYEDLKPFETRSIVVTFNVNSPQETPAVNNGDVLSFSAKIYPVDGDENPKDNIGWLRDTVVGSHDPNDKTCLEGTEVLQEMIGEYVHYRIRFENKGTFAAENIVVVDEIDESKYDISTLVSLDASHDFETRIIGNKVEFIFEGIQLPYDAEDLSDTVNTDDNNDGYVIFKIKTLPTLKLGDSFSNQASIYFDFNFPIITNNETTTIVEEHLGVADFDFNQELTLYPNPVQDRLYITAKSDAKVLSLEIYNIQGQLVQAVPEVTKMSFDVSNLAKGTYLVSVKTDRGVAVTKMVKE